LDPELGPNIEPTPDLRPGICGGTLNIPAASRGELFKGFVRSCILYKNSSFFHLPRLIFWKSLLGGLNEKQYRQEVWNRGHSLSCFAI
jgi:hypothetical protein